MTDLSIETKHKKTPQKELDNRKEKYKNLSPEEKKHINLNVSCTTKKYRRMT